MPDPNPTPAPPADPTPQNIITDPAPTPTPPADPTPPPANKDGNGDPPKIDNILGGDPPPANPNPPPANPPPANTGDDDGELTNEAKWKGVIDAIRDDAEIVVGKTAIDGAEAKIGAAELRALYPALQKAGIQPEQAHDVAKALAALEGARIKADNEGYVKAINAKAAECRQQFGADFDRVRRFATKGLGMMDKSLRDELLATPVLVNDHRFIRFLAEIGEKLSIDDGGSAGAQPHAGGGIYDPAAWVETSNRRS
jgi:hypothetical protein